MSRYLLSVKGISARGRHGANEGEREASRELVVDLEVEADVTADELGATIDYRTLADVVRETVEITSFQLLESLAQAVADRVLTETAVVAVSVTVHKPSAAGSMGVEDVAATATRNR